MEKEIKRGVAERLIDARQTGLKEIQDTAMRPHGKLWGMDVFSWYLPSPTLVENTLQTLPFPIIWVGNSKDIYRTLELNPSLTNKLHSVVIHDTPEFILKPEWMNEIPVIIGLHTVDDALKTLRPLKQNQTILLFSLSGDNWKTEKTIFENFMSLHQ